MKDLKYGFNFNFKFCLELHIILKFICILHMINLIKSDDCFITNKTKITSQWLNNIICLGDKNLKYINFATFSNGDMVVEATSNVDSLNKRIFYGIKIDGKPFFKNGQYHSIILISGETKSNNARYEADNCIVTINNIEYLLSIGNSDDKYAELYDLNNCETKSQLLAVTFLGVSKIMNIRGFATNLTSSGNDYIIYALLNKRLTYNNFILKKLYFSSTELSDVTQQTSDAKSSIGGSISCFVTDFNKIICLYLYKGGLAYYYYYIDVYDENLNKLLEEQTEYFPDLEISKDYSIFLKCIHLEEETGAFIFIKARKRILTYTNELFPTIIFKTYDGSSSMKNFLNSIELVELKQKEFTIDCLLNDLIKISNRKLCFSSTSSSKQQLYIVLINIYNKNILVLRYYSIEIFSKYTFMFFTDMKLHLYNKYAAFAFNFCRQTTCKDEDDLHYSAFMIFNYPNGTDYNLNIIEYLFNNNNIKLNSLNIDLGKNVRIDNNIFGLIYSSIKIKQIINCDNMNFYSSENENPININSTLEKNEKIKIEFNSYNNISCLIQYVYIITEPDFNKYNEYCERITTYGEDNEDIFNKEKYEGRVLDYYIVIDNNLETQCDNESCELCYENKKNYCITCEYTYTIETIDSIKTKICDVNTDNPKIESETSIINEDKETNLETTTKITYIDSTQKEETEKTYVDSTQKEETEKAYVDSTQKEETEITQIDSTQKEETEITQIDSTQKEETEKTYADSTQKEETEIIHIDSTQTEETKINKDNQIDTTIIYNINNDNKKEETSNIEKSDPKICTNKEIINNECGNGKMSNEQVGEVYTSIKENFLTEDYNGENTIIETENVVIQISTLEEQKNSINPNVSTIDLGECENILKEKYNISKDYSLIVLKTDIKNDDLSVTYVQYEIYHPITKKQLDLKYCNDIKITVNVPVNLDDNAILLYDSLSESGYNLFDSEDDFYNDICSTYTSENGTDMTLADRKDEIYSVAGNITMCQTGCIFELYNKTTKKAKCNCDAQVNSTETDISKIEFSISNILLSTLTNSNFLVLKCYQLAISLKNIFKNKGRIIMTIIYFFFMISLFIYIINDRKKINIFINLTLKAKVKITQPKPSKIVIKKIDKLNIKNDKKNDKKDKKEKLDLINIKDNKGKHKDINKNKDKDKNKIKKKDNKKEKENKLKQRNNIKKKNNKRNKTSEPPKKRLISKINKKNNRINTTTKILSSNSNIRTSNKLDKININIIPINNVNYNNFQNNNKKNKKKSLFDNHVTSKIQLKTELENKISEENLNNIYKHIDFKTLNDQELNSLEYNIAIIKDKRTYLQYYWSLLKKKQLILFTILPANDYNLYSLKISFFLLTFSLYFTINGFFFSDETMHKIHKDNGAFNIIVQIPQILYSTVISSVINMLLKKLSLSEKNILDLKQEKDLKKATQISKNIKLCITIKFIIFFILSNILLLFFWYFLSCFCAVYINTQDILIEDTLVSFCLSMAYPFGLNLLPGIFRIPALRAKNKDKKLLYQISGLVALI